MHASIFDSKSEEKLYSRMKTFWSKYIDVFPQLPVSKVIGYQNIDDQNISRKAKDFLKKSSFDFVICDQVTHAPVLVIEFDGLGGGFSKDGKYIHNLKKKEMMDPHRALKMQKKLDICNEFLIPIVVVSYEECDLLKESEQMITILDAIIGDALEKSEASKNYVEYSKMLAEAYDFAGEPAVEITMLEIDLMREKANPIKRKIKAITSKFPRWPTTIHFTRPDEKGILRETFKHTAGLVVKNGVACTKCLLSVTVSMREVCAPWENSFFLFNTIGEYCLAMKAKKILGNDPESWQSAYDQAEWSEL
jgi:hypothetical protein